MGDLGRWLMPLGIGVAAIYSGSSVTTLPGERYAFAAVLLLAALLAARAKIRSLPPKIALLSAAWTCGLGVWTLMAAVQPATSWSYVVGDLALATLPLFVVLAYSARPAWLEDQRPLVFLAGCLLVAAVVAREFGRLGDRHDPPSSLLIVASWFWLLRARTWRHRLLAAVVVGLVLVLAYSSGYRTHLGLWAVAPVVLSLNLGLRRLLGTAVVGLVVVWFVAATFSVSVNPIDALEQSRYESILSGRPDESLGSRQLEAYDVVETIDREWLPGQFVVGHGFGATYVPDRSYIERNIGDDGRVHNVHFGPVLVWFRFGLLGVLAYGAMLFVIVKSMRNRSLHEQPLALVCASGVLIFTGEFMVLNATVQPAMSWCFGVFMAFWLRPRSGPAHGGGRSVDETHGHRISV